MFPRHGINVLVKLINNYSILQRLISIKIKCTNLIFINTEYTVISYNI